MSLGRDYLEIVLGLRRLVPDWIEDSVGTLELVDATETSEQARGQALCERVHELIERVRCEETDPDRSR